MGLLIPEDTLVGVSSFLPKKELLALRAVAVLGRDAVAVAVRAHPADEVFKPEQQRTKNRVPICPVLPARAIDTIGRVLGPRYRQLSLRGIFPDEYGAAFATFAANTHGALESVDIFCSGISTETLLKICRASPRLTKLSVVPYDYPENPNQSDEYDYSALASVGLTCPLLSDVRYPRGPAPRSPMETWASYFPKLERLSLSNGRVNYVPSDFGQIEVAATQCVEATKLNLEGCLVHPNLVDFLLRTPLSTRVTCLSLTEASILPEIIIDAARGFVGLRGLQLPDEFAEDRHFYESLARARPEIKRLDCGYGNKADNACLKRISELFMLETLVITGMDNLTKDVIPMILASPCRQSLRELGVYYVDAFGYDEIQAFVAGCPLLSTFEFEDDAENEDRVVAIEHEIGPLLMSRGGGWGIKHFFWEGDYTQE